MTRQKPCSDTAAERRPRLLWVNHFAVTPSEGGGTRHLELGRQLVRRGWDVAVLASDLDLHTRRYTRRPSGRHRAIIREDHDGVEFRWLWSSEYRRNDWRRGLNWLTFFWSVSRAGRAEPAPDIVIGSTPHLFAAFAAYRLARRASVPFVLEVRDLWPESLIAAGGRRGPLYYLLRRIADHLYARAEAIIVLARGSRDYLAGRGVDEAKIHYVPNGVDPDWFSDNEPSSGESFTCVYAGAHGPANGLNAVLDAAELLRNEPGIRFVLVGDGPAKTELLADATRRDLRNVEFRASIPRSSVPELFREADAGLMVLRDSPLFRFGVSPNKLFDYLAARLPVVSNVPGEVADMLRASGAGVQASEAGGAGLARAVLRLRELPESERRRMGRSGREWVEREHGRATLGARLHEQLKQLLDSP